MTQENAPAPDAPKESVFKNSRFGLLSLAIFILWLILFWLTTSMNTSGPLYYATFVSSIVETVFAMIGLFRDGKKWAAITALILGVVPLCFTLFLLSIELNGGSGMLP